MSRVTARKKDLIWILNSDLQTLHRDSWISINFYKGVPWQLKLLKVRHCTFCISSILLTSTYYSNSTIMFYNQQYKVSTSAYTAWGDNRSCSTLTLFTSGCPDLQAAASALDDSLHPVGTKAMPPCLEGKNSGIYFSEPPAEQAMLTPHLRPHPCLPPPTLTFRATHTVFLRIIPSISFTYGIPISGSASGKPDLKPRQEL